MPFESTRTIHPDWNTHHAPVATGAMTSTCEIRDPDAFTEAFDRDSGLTVTVPAGPVYTGPCRVQAASGQRPTRADAAGQDVSTPPYQVEVVFDGPAFAEGYRVLVTADADDPQLVGRTFTVRQVQVGSHRFSRVLLCDDQ